MNKIQDLLDKVSSFIAEYSKQQEENPQWNIFYAIGGSVYRDELIHSYFLHTLLKTKVNGKYSFLKLFVEMLNEKFNFEFDYKDFSASNRIKTEYNLGPISKDFTSGGRIDIILYNPKESIIIEDKIFAKDQPAQLYRYYKGIKKSKIFYLTLYGTEPSEISVHNMLKEGGKYYLLSYKKDILSWIQNCQKQTIKIPSLKLALAQYEEIIKNLPHKENTSKMEKEIIQTASQKAEDVLASFYIRKNYNSIYNTFIRAKLLEPIKEFLKQKFGEDYKLTEEYFQNKPENLIFGFTVKHKNWQNIVIRFNGETFNHYIALYGISSCYGKVAPKSIFEYFSSENFPSNKPSQMWPLIYELEYSPLSLEFLQKMITEEGKIIVYYKSKVEEMVLLAKKAEQDGIVL